MELLHVLERLNRKERFFLFKTVINDHCFTLSDRIRQQLQEQISLDIPRTAFFAIDYHLDWLYAALMLHQSKDTNKIYPTDDVHVNQNQEDIDLIIAYRDTEYYHIVLVEAKGTLTWTNKQLQSKVQKLQRIFGANFELCPPDVKLYFVLSSPRKPQRINVSEWPQWLFGNDGQLRWFQLEVPNDRLKITRCTDAGTPNYDGAFWTYGEQSQR